MDKKQEAAVRNVIQLRAGIDEARRRVDAGVYRAVRVRGVPVRVLADETGLTKSRIYQMLKNHAEGMQK